MSDFENLHDVSDLSDRELRDLVRSELRAHKGLDVDYITIHVKNGDVTLDGRVGTDYERRVAERVITDVLGIANVTNQLVVQSMHRAESPEAIDEHLVDE